MWGGGGSKLFYDLLPPPPSHHHIYNSHYLFTGEEGEPWEYEGGGCVDRDDYPFVHFVQQSIKG
jgi:hypothetical protein